MRRKLVFLILLLITFFPESGSYLIYAGSLSEKVAQHDPDCPYAKASLRSEGAKEPGIKDEAGYKAEIELEEQMEKEEKEEIENLIKHARLIYEKIAKRTKECRDMLDSEFFTVNSYARKATEAKDFRSEREFVNVLSDYNSVLGDIGLMQVILELGKFVEGEKFLDYYNLMESGYERLKDSFSLKNELFLKRIDELRNQNALRYEKKLLREYKGYFEYDPRLEKAAEVGAGDGVKPGNMENKK
ncbi:MAG: hypothetical protein PHT50_01165 [Candidatus Omnitrophica bacterium]|nr:hypothetical protein [Candidatus Omnitrophota bacterium]